MTRIPARILAPLATGVTLLSTAWTAHAQKDLEFDVPDILLLVDSSGSMGLTSVRDPDDASKYALPKCGTFPTGMRPVDVHATNFGGPSTPTPPDRWTMLVDALTGSIQGLACSSQSRSSTEFSNEYKLDGNAPYDHEYYLPFNRIIASQSGKMCTPAPSPPYHNTRTLLRENAIEWPTGGPIYWRDISFPFDADPPPACSIPTQDTNGVIDQFQVRARLGLMTFDSKPHYLVGTTKTVGTGIFQGFDPPKASYPDGIGDTWSFFPNWMANSSAGATGWPGGCSQQGNPLLEVGARNPAAPPWEGRLIDFGDPLAGTDKIISNNERVQQALLAMRPFGATPIAGMLEDARYFLLEDKTKLIDTANIKNPTNPKEIEDNTYFRGGAVDPAVSKIPGNGCRKRFVILLTDGGPNMDLRPDCAYTVNGIKGNCPYDTPENSVKVLVNNNIPVFVIGFAITAGAASDTCTGLLKKGTDPCGSLKNCTDKACGSGQCAYGYCINEPSDETLAACCKIKGIADIGSGKGPFFVETYGALKKAFQEILNEASPGTRSRTQPVFATGNANFSSSGGGAIAGARFLTSFDSNAGDLLAGKLERLRFKCTKPTANAPPEAVLQTLDPGSGDDFDANVDTAKNERRVYTVVAEPDSSDRIHSTRTVRPLYNESGGDGLGNVGVLSGDPQSFMVSGLASVVDQQVDPRAMVDASNSCFSTPTDPAPTASSCRTRFLRMQLGFSLSSAGIEFQRASVLGAIMRTTPIVVGPPQDYLRDESYTKFQRTMGLRPSVLYAPTIDGQLHAFEIMKTTQTLNELWTFMPPAVLPRIASQFPDRFNAAPQALLDGPIVVRDVAGETKLGPKGRFLTRTKDDALDPSVGNVRWHSILVGAFGSTPGYYALDVSWPDPATTQPPGYVKGPRFLWQLTTDEDGQSIFGSRSAPPSISTLYFTMPGDSTAAEHAVAILPGGFGGSRTDNTVNVMFDKSNIPSVDSRLTVRDKTHAYDPASDSDEDVRSLGGARSLTIVRLDTGEVVRTFRRGTAAPDADEHQAPDGLYSQNRITPSPFDSPITGHVITYPNGSGAVANRAYVGDAEGRLWRVDLSSKDPSNWTVNLFHDTFPKSGLTGISYTEADAAPIETPPILSTDPFGRVTLAMSTGEQRTITEQGEFPVWSLTESLSKEGVPTARVNWFLSHHNAKNPKDNNGGVNHLAGGERVTGSMTLFDSVLYFTTYDPSKEDPRTCGAGESFLWAVHYINAGTNSSATPKLEEPELGPMPWLDPTPPDDDPNTPDTPSKAMDFVRYSSLGAGSVAFGVGLQQKPACYQIVDVPADSFLGYGVHRSISSVTPSKFQLVVQTGRVGDATGTETKTTTRNLFPPLGGGRIDSWTAILE